MNAQTTNPTRKVIKYELSDIIRSKWVLAYMIFFLGLTESLFRLGGSSTQVMLSLTNAILILIPLVCLVFGTMYIYTARPFIELMLAQPLKRQSLFTGLYLGLTLPLTLGFILGIAVPFAFHGVTFSVSQKPLIMILLTGTLLTFIFNALALLIAVRMEDKVKALGLSIFIWLFFTVIYDGLVLATVQYYGDYPLEKPIIAMTLLNPVDLARVLLLLQFDISALMGYTGALFEQFFGSLLGIVVSLTAMTIWIIVPFLLGRRLFQKKDF
jgi:Cu-processing system permease protein